MKAWRILLAAVAIQLFGMVFSMITCGWLFTWVYQLEPLNIWKPMEGGPGIDFFATTFVLHIIFVFVYVLLRNGLPGKNLVVKGLFYGLCVWAVGALPCLYMTLYFMTIAPTVVVYWAITGLIGTPISGVIASSIYGKN